MVLGSDCRRCWKRAKNDIEICAPCFEKSLIPICDRGCLFCTKPQQSDQNPDYCIDCYICYQRNKYPLDDLITISYLVDGLDYVINGKNYNTDYYVQPLSSLLFTYLKYNYEKINSFYNDVFGSPISHITYIPPKEGRNHIEKILNYFPKKYWEHNYPISSILGINIYNDSQKRKKYTDREFKKNKFKLKKGINVENKVIMIFDDTYTRGGTLNSAAYLLKKSGAKRVIGFTIARHVIQEARNIVMDRAEMKFDIKQCKYDIEYYRRNQRFNF